MTYFRSARCVVLSALAAFCVQACAEEWPQWRGPHHDGISRETGLLSQWPAGGPRARWRVPLGMGYSSVSVAGGKAVTMFGTEDGEFVVALDASSGKVLWKTPSGPLFHNTYGNGPRSTPTIDAGRVYSLGATGSLLALDAASGTKIWGFNVLEKFGGEAPEFGLSSSPVVAGNMLLVVTGAKHGKSLVALDRSTGSVLWSSLNDKAGYSTPLVIDVGGQRQVVVLMGEAVVGVAIGDGRELWRRPWKTTLDANVATPIFHQNRLFISTGYGTGCGMFELGVGGQSAVKELWKSKEMKNYFSTSVLIDGCLYGFDNTFLVAMDFQTGKVKWRERGFNRGSLLAADGKLVILGERASLALAEVSPAKYTELARAKVLDGKTWTVPTLADGRLFVRNEKELVCLDLRH
jgi:outer membrane protein assembly factor BamB